MTTDLSPGDSVDVSDGTVSIVAVTVNTVTYHHPDWDSTYVVSADSFADYAGASA